MKYWILIFAAFLFSCRTTKHIQKEKSETHQVQTKDSLVQESAKTVTEKNTEETYERDIDTTITPKPVKGKAKIPKPTPGKTDTTTVYDSLGNKLGQVASSLDEQSNALNLDFNLQPPDVHANLHEKGTKKSGEKKTQDNNKSAALHSTNQVDAKNENATRDVVRKTDVWAWIKWIAIGAAVLALIIYRGHIWKWLKNKILKK